MSSSNPFLYRPWKLSTNKLFILQWRATHLAPPPPSLAPCIPLAPVVPGPPLRPPPYHRLGQLSHWLEIGPHAGKREERRRGKHQTWDWNAWDQPAVEMFHGSFTGYASWTHSPDGCYRQDLKNIYAWMHLCWGASSCRFWIGKETRMKRPEKSEISPKEHVWFVPIISLHPFSLLTIAAKDNLLNRAEP